MVCSCSRYLKILLDAYNMITSTSPNIIVTNSNGYIPYNNSTYSIVRYNRTSERLEVSPDSGSTWYPFYEHCNISLNADTENVLRWAKEKMNQEEQIRALAERYPAVRDMAETARIANEQLSVMVKLLQDQKTEV